MLARSIILSWKSGQILPKLPKSGLEARLAYETILPRVKRDQLHALSLNRGSGSLVVQPGECSLAETLWQSFGSAKNVKLDSAGKICWQNIRKQKATGAQPWNAVAPSFAKASCLRLADGVLQM
jgi:hypothetical protein